MLLKILGSAFVLCLVPLALIAIADGMTIAEAIDNLKEEL